MPSGPRSEEKREIGRRVAAARRRVGMTQAQLAGKLGISVKTVQTWERGLANPYRRVQALESALDLRPGSLLTIEGHGTQQTIAPGGFHLRSAPLHVVDIELPVPALLERLERLEAQVADIQERMKGP